MSIQEQIQIVEDNLNEYGQCNITLEEFDYLKKQIKADAIDELVRFANTMPTIENDDGEIRPMWLEEMAEQLKDSK